MEDTSENKAIKHKKHISAGLLAHVDAGKTTLSESLLYISGAIRKLGRVDNKDAFLDTDAMERQRGITIFSKQARIQYKDLNITLLDTPGHVDFSAEMERTLQVLDYAILVINGADGVQTHTRTLWMLLKRYDIPVFLFINKMDQTGTDAEKLMANIHEKLDDSCIDFSNTVMQKGSDEWYESIAMCEEHSMEYYLEYGTLKQNHISDMIAGRDIFPCFFGSALKLQGVDLLLDGLEDYTLEPVYPSEFGAQVYKIARDELGNRLTYMKITGGSLKVRDLIGQEKVNQIRLYSGEKYMTENEVSAGTVCAVTGLTQTMPGEGIGAGAQMCLPILEPTLRYALILPEDCDPHKMLQQMKLLQEEDPLLHVEWEEESGTIYVRLMGDIQIQILRQQILERFQVEAAFGTGSIVYKETITDTVEGVGHFEPLHHYAEVHLKLEPGEPGSGLVFDTDCSEDLLEKNWKRLVMTHLAETDHPGVLTGSAITDMKITVIGGRAHKKHTEGGDFRQATYRAVRQGLKKAESVLLEPVYAFRLVLPADCLGRAMTDIQKMEGTCDPPDLQENFAVLTGHAPVSEMRDYHREVTAYSRGEGKLSCVLSGYMPCHNAEEVIETTGYDSEADLSRPTGSVFCAHGCGFSVPWYEVEAYMHVEAMESLPEDTGDIPVLLSGRQQNYVDEFIEEEEVDAILQRTTHANASKKPNQWKRKKGVEGQSRTVYQGKSSPYPKEECLLVDGYNIIFAWEDLRELAEVSLDGARDSLMDILCNYQGYKKCTLILVFDAYKVKGNPGEVMAYHNIHVVYTKEAETADQYIEKTVHQMSRTYRVRVATSDGLEQMIILGEGAARISAREFRQEVEAVSAQICGDLEQFTEKRGTYLLDDVKGETAAYVEQIKTGKTSDMMFHK